MTACIASQFLTACISVSIDTTFIEPCLNSSLTSNDYMHILQDGTNHSPIMNGQQVHMII